MLRTKAYLNEWSTGGTTPDSLKIGSMNVSYFFLMGIESLSIAILTSKVVVILEFFETSVTSKRFEVEFNVKIVAVEDDWNSDWGRFALGKGFTEQ